MKSKITRSFSPQPCKLICQTAFSILLICLSNVLIAQGSYGMPKELLNSDSTAQRPITITEISENYEDLMSNSDSSLTSAKKRAQRWFSYVLPYLNVKPDGTLSNDMFMQGIEALYTSPLQCDNGDLAEWESDGPYLIPNKSGKSRGGWVSSIYNHPSYLNTLLAGTRTSGIMKSTNGGLDWHCVTDDLTFPVLGVRKLLADREDYDRIYALTGNSWIEGNLIYSDDAGEDWYENTQDLPQILDISNHPSTQETDVMFAISSQDLFVSYDNGVTFQSAGVPPDLTNDTQHKDFYQIRVLENSIYLTSTYRYNPEIQIYRGEYTLDSQNQSISISWTSNVQNDLLDEGSGEVAINAYFSNLALNRFYLYIQHTIKTVQGNGNIEYDDDTKINNIYKSSDFGSTFIHLPYLSGNYTGFTDDNQIVGDIHNKKCELIASPNNSNVLYNGMIHEVQRWYDNATDYNQDYKIDNINFWNGGHHDDYRSSQIINDNGQDRLIFGNDGGVALVQDGLAPQAKMEKLNGDLSINLIHAFDVHEETGRTLFAFQDHNMLYRDPGNNYPGSGFLHEGSFAMIQQHHVDGMVGQGGYDPGYIKDKNDNPNGIVSTNLSPAYLGAYQEHYRHYPERFAAGFLDGQIALNRGKDDSHVINITYFQNEGSENDDNYPVGDVAVCQRKPQFLYAARLSVGSSNNENCLVKSINDAGQLDNNDPWINLSESLVSGLNVWGSQETRTLKDLCNYRNIRALEVDHFDENIVYCGIGTVYNEWNGQSGSESGNEIKDEKYRVLRSVTGGNPDPNNPDNAAWIDWSEGLPALPIERLLTVESDNHLIFAATSVGIYYRTDNDSTWQCFSEGLPKVQITGLQYDYCNNMLYASTYGRGLWKTPVNLPVTNSFSVTVSEDETWDENKTIHTDITVTNGAELTITSIIRMATGKNIIVEPGAQLTLDGGTLTNACGAMWQGIIIKGNTDLPQTISNQGVVVTKNDATIANARTALKFIYPDDWGSRGGIAWCKNTTFYNNKRSAAFYKYPSTDELETYDTIPDYKSHFIDCEFLFDNENLLNEGEDAPFSQVTLWGVKGVKFLGCKFENTEDVSQSEFRSRGIFSSDASYRIDDYCEVPVPVGGNCPTANLIPSSFSGYHTAVHPSGVAGNYSPTIRHTDFDQNMVGVYLDLANGSQIIGNEFVVGSHPYDTPIPSDDNANYNTGILTVELTDFIIEDNTFNGDDTFTDFTHGVTVQSGGGALVEVYNNRLNNLGSGVIGAGDNDDDIGNGAYGLRFLCNKNTGNATDIEVRNIDGEFPFGYIDANQAGTEFTSQAAGNTFSMGDGFNTNYVHMDYKSDKSYSYQYNDTDPEEIPDTTNEVYITPPGDIYGQLTTIEHNCPLTETDGGIVKQEYKGIKSEFYNLLYTYHQFIDEGNTEAALNDVALSWSTDAWTLRDNLMARSPNNSDTVLIAAADKNILPHGMLLEVLVSNPDALQDGTVIRHVQCCIANSMPQYMIDILYASRNLQTARTIIERNLGNLRHRMAARHRVVLQDILTDTVATHPDTIIDLLDDLRHKEGRYMLISEYLNRGNYALARAEMDSLQSQIKLGAKGTFELNKMRQFTNFLSNIDSQGKNFAQLDSVEINFLVNLANTPNAGTAGARAENILCFFYDDCSPPPSAPKNNNNIAPRKPKPSYEELVNAQNKVMFSPNPADQYIQMKYELLFAKKNTEMRVFDQLGRKVTSYLIGATTQGVEILDTRKLTQGVYIVEIVQEGRQVFSDKFIVQH